MNITRIKAAARKALIAANPDYHAWPQTQQEQFRASMDDATNNRVDSALLNDLLRIQCNAENAGDIWREVPPSKLDHLNWAKLLTTGIGDDMMYLNESMAENTSLLDFETLYDYDYDNHLFQEQNNKEQFKNYQGRDYSALRFSCWARLLINNQFYYATLFSLAGYLTENLEEHSDDILQTLIPNEYVEGKNHGKQEKGGYLWDMQIDANGLEQQLDELKSRWYNYIQKRWTALSREFTEASPALYTEDLSDNNENHRNFIFNNEHVLKRIHWRHFLADCEALRANFSVVADRQTQEIAQAENWLRENHEDIIKNFDPNVVKLKKKRKIVIAPEAFDGLLGEDGDK